MIKATLLGDPGSVPRTHAAGSQLLTAVPGNPMPSSDISGTGMYMMHKHTCGQNVDTRKIIK